MEDFITDDESETITIEKKIENEFKSKAKYSKIIYFIPKYLPTSVTKILSNEKYRDTLCKFCLNGDNLIIEKDVVISAFCGSCCKSLSEHFLCPVCDGKCWVNKLGMSSRVCKNCFGLKKKEDRIGDWKCSKCSNYNYSFRKECNRCGLEKIESVIVPDDWKCSSCGYLNYCHRDNCNNCGTINAMKI